jgi:hypothetical protein
MAGDLQSTSSKDAKAESDSHVQSLCPDGGNVGVGEMITEADLSRSYLDRRAPIDKWPDIYDLQRVS